MTPEIKHKVIVHIEDEFQDWGNLIRGIENSILQGIPDENDYDTFRSELLGDSADSPAITKITWTQNRTNYSVHWIAVREAVLDDDLRKKDLWKGISNTDTFFVVDGLREKPSGMGSYASVGESLENISDLLNDTYKQVRIFTAYKEDFVAGEYPVDIRIKSEDGTETVSCITEHPELMLSKSMRKNLKAELGEMLREFVTRG